MSRPPVSGYAKTALGLALFAWTAATAFIEIDRRRIGPLPEDLGEWPETHPLAAAGRFLGPVFGVWPPLILGLLALAKIVSESPERRGSWLAISAIGLAAGLVPWLNWWGR